jgi:DNA-binding transcriptional regulator YiaG
MKCQKCGHEWQARTKNPKACPACKSYGWDKNTPETSTSKKSAITYSRMKARKKIKEIYPDIKRNQHVHHIDGNPLNNDIDNLCVMSASEHVGFHHRHYEPETVIDWSDPIKAIKSIRYKTGWSSARLGAEIGKSGRTVEGWEQGRPIDAAALKLMQMIFK